MGPLVSKPLTSECNMNDKENIAWYDKYKKTFGVVMLVAGFISGNVDRIYNYVVKPADFNALVDRVEELEEKVDWLANQFHDTLKVVK